MHSAVMTHALSSEACVGGVCPVAGIAHTQEFAALLAFDSSVCPRVYIFDSSVFSRVCILDICIKIDVMGAYIGTRMPVNHTTKTLLGTINMIGWRP